jgi:hypothetical protein
MREILSTPNLNWCEVMRSSVSNPLYFELVKVVKNLEPKMVHQCPYNNFIIENKIPDISTLPSIFSAGYYKLWVNMTDRNLKTFFHVETLIDWVSSEKNSFG